MPEIPMLDASAAADRRNQIIDDLHLLYQEISSSDTALTISVSLAFLIRVKLVN
jgi:hypothetical protein